MGSLGAAIARIVVLQKALVIAAPITQQIKTAYAEPPPLKTALDAPCWINWVDYPAYQRSNAMRSREYLIHMQLFIKDEDQASAIARAYKEVLDDALDADITLEGACVLQRNLRGGERELDWAGMKYRGLDLMLEVVVGWEAKTFAP